MREIVWDTETTGLDHASDRICEIGAVELVNTLPTGREFHVYINPAMPMPPDATRVHGLTDAFLADKPLFEAVVDDFLTFVGDARLVAHNAGFDLGMLNAELRRLGRPPFPESRSLDSSVLAMQKFPGARASLDALCRRFDIDLSAREKHGALLDSQLLAEVYLELQGGRQQGLELGRSATTSVQGVAVWRAPARPRALPSRRTPAEAAAHEAFIAELGSESVWARLG